jgi:hypothetical protein
MAIGFPVKDDYVSGDVLTAANMNDLSGSVNLLESAQYAAGKNKIINGDFSVNQRNFTSVTTADDYGFDLWRQTFSGGTCTNTPQTFTPGAAPVAGYEGNKYSQIVTASQSAAGDFAIYYIRLEDARLLAGQTATLSFWAKVASGTPKIAAEIRQNFGTGGSPSAGVTTYLGQATLSTSYVRYSLSVSVPSISGKTFGTNNNSYLAVRVWLSAGSTFDANTGSIGINNNTFSLWGFQLEAGSVATAFQTATGTIQGELAACQRYYFRTSSPGSTQTLVVPTAFAFSSVESDATIQFPVAMRTSPSSVDFSNLVFSRFDNTGYNLTAITLATNTGSSFGILLYGTIVGGTAGNVGKWTCQSTASAHLGFSAEL